MPLAGLPEQGASLVLAAADDGDAVAAGEPFQGDRAAHAVGTAADDHGLLRCARHGLLPRIGIDRPIVNGSATGGKKAV
ncbi:hypothetical protein GCM10010400_15090 [Streptomyces aculeolatus]